MKHVSPSAPQGPELFGQMWTQHASMKQMFRLVERVAQSDASVLVRGETGAGKELVARALHDHSPRSAGPYRAINCAALPANLLESELFGHARGAFTGAVNETPGHFQLAHRGTLFLDEVAEVPLELQAKLLRVLDTRTVTRVGGRDPIPIDVRIVSATHRALRSEVAAGRFRADLMFRLRVIPIYLPPLRDRPGDVTLLTEKLVAALNARSRRRVDQIAPEALRALEAYPWPGNVRELRNALEYAFAVGDGPTLLPGDLPPEVFDGPEGDETSVEHAVSGAPRSGGPADAATLPAEAQRLLHALALAGGQREAAARTLGISRVTLWRRMKAYGLV